MENSNTDLLQKAKFVWFFLGPVVGWIIGFFTKRFHIRYQIKWQNYETAKTNFISAFDPVLERFAIYGDEPSKVLLKAMPNHKIVFDKFRIIVARTKGTKTVRRLDQVWADYYSGNQPHAKYQSKPRRENAVKEAKKLAIQKIQAIIDFVNKEL